jgi:WD40 repeat protein/DNA-binding SARP family transcriptional activator
MEIRLLGPVEVQHGNTPLPLRGPKQRAVLAMLALSPNATVPVDRLIEGLWGERQPATAAKMVQLYVSQLRKVLAHDGASEIVTRGRAYELHLDPDSIDAARFERLVVEAAAARGDGGSGETAHAALALWRGRPLADLEEPFADAEVRRLEELHLAAVELAIEADLEAGRHTELIGELDALLAEHPLSERLHALRMLALYRAGRQAEALEGFRTARALLVEEIGVEPGPELRRLQEAILRQDPVLDLAIPGREWATRETAARVDDAATRTSVRRGELRQLESALAADVVDLHALQARAAAPAEAAQDDEPICPYKGLASFDAVDAEYFFGRERLVAEIVARLVGTTIVGLVGPSGSGKSSTLRAGLLPALAEGVLPGSESWRQVVLRPGEHAVADLRRELENAGSDERLVLALDQFEELFTTHGDAERAAYVDALVDVAESDDGRLIVVLAVRADYYGACAAHPRLARLLGESHVLVGPMRPEELARAIAEPARKAGLAVDRDLVTKLVDDVAGQPGALPLLSTALLELWQHRDGRRMRLAAYERTGGVDGAVARLAEQAYGSLSEDEQRVARRILLRLAGSEEGDAVVRRRVALDELDTARDERAARVLEVLAASRLVTVGDGTAEVAHEALLREWPRLGGWLEEDTDGRRLHRHITLAASEWDAGGRDAGEVYRGVRLSSALDWGAEHGDELNTLEREFLEAGRAAGEHEVERSRRANRRLRMLLAGACVALTVAVIAGVIALDQRGDARGAAEAADAQRLGAQAVTDDRLDHALLLARAGIELDESLATRGSLLSVLLRHPAALGELHDSDGWPLWALGVSPDGRLLALGGERGVVTILDTATREQVGKPYAVVGEGVIQQLRFSPDSRTLAVVGEQRGDTPPRHAILDLLDARTGERRLRVDLPRFPSRTPADVVYGNVSFMPNGRDMVVQQSHVVFQDHGYSGPPSLLYRVDARTGAVDRHGVPIGSDSSPGLAATADGRRLFATSAGAGETYEIDPRRLRVIRRYPIGGSSMSVRPDGRKFAIGSDDGRLRIFDPRSGAVTRLSGRHDSPLSRTFFAADGRTLVSSRDDGEVLVWDLPEGTVRETYSAHDAGVSGLEITSDGKTLYTAGLDTRAFAWDLSGERRLVQPFDAGPSFVPDDGDEYPKGLATSPDGKTLAVSQSDGTVILVDAETLQERRSARVLGGFVAAIAFSPDGRLLAATGKDGEVRLVDGRTLSPVGKLTGLGSTSQALAFSHDGRLLAASENFGGPVRIWDVGRRELTGVKFRTLAPSLEFSPDGRFLALAAFDRGFEIRDPATGEVVKRLKTDDMARSVAFTPSGDVLATGTYDGMVQLWSTESWRPIGPPLEGHNGRILSLAFTPDGRMLASGSEDGTVLLRDVETQRAIGSPLRVDPGVFVTALFSRDGSELFAVSSEERAVRVATTTEAWKQHACAVAGRDLTEDEWYDILPDRTFGPVCASG